MFFVRLAKKERYHYTYRMAAILVLTLGFFVFVQFLNAPSPIAAQENPTPEVTVTLKTTPCRPNNAAFVRDVTIIDGKILKRNEFFIKTWRVGNTGPCAWTEGYSIRFLQGFSNFGTDSAPLPPAEPGQEVDISLELVAPTEAGPYPSLWGLFDSAGQQFGTLSVSISVSPDLAAATPTPTVAPTQSPSPTPLSPTEIAVTPSVPSEGAVEGSASTPSADATAITEADSEVVGSEENEETPTENSQWSVGYLILLLILVVLLLIVLLVILWQRRRRFSIRQHQNHNQKSARLSEVPPNNRPSRASQPVEWNLDLDPPIGLPATLSESPQGVPYLESLDNPTGPVYFALNQPVSRVGRGEENELRIDDSFMGWQTVSRHHAKIERDGEDSILIDQNSLHGTKVDGRHSNTNLLQNDCIISFGLVKFAFRNPTKI